MRKPWGADVRRSWRLPLIGTSTESVRLLVVSIWLASGALGCVSAPAGTNVDRVSRTGIEFFTFLQSRGSSVAELRSSLPEARVDSIFLIDPNVSNAELADFVRVDASGYPFEIFLRVIVSKVNHQVYRYVVRGDWRGVKMGYRALSRSDLYDAIYLHTHPDEKRILPVSLNDFIHASVFPDVMTLVVGGGIALEFETADSTQSETVLDVDGSSTALKRPVRVQIRNKHQATNRRRDAEGVTFKLDRLFRQKVHSGHRRVTLQNPEGMLVTFDRDQTLTQRLDAVYLEADIALPALGSQWTRIRVDSLTQ
jgi:hypothetical protein